MAKVMYNLTTIFVRCPLVRVANGPVEPKEYNIALMRKTF